jgi:hypothetical protein
MHSRRRNKSKFHIHWLVTADDRQRGRRHNYYGGLLMKLKPVCTTLQSRHAFINSLLFDETYLKPSLI